MSKHFAWTWSYFKPKDWERIQSLTIYDFLGIRLYKKYLPTSGDLVNKWRNKKQLQLDRGRWSELSRLELQTRKYEWRHILGLAGFIIILLVIDKKLTGWDWIFLILLNLAVNIYPIFLQRHNRIRVINIFSKAGIRYPDQI